MTSRMVILLSTHWQRDGIRLIYPTYFKLSAPQSVLTFIVNP